MLSGLFKPVERTTEMHGISIATDQISSSSPTMPIKAVIFDRDGTLIEHIPYLSNPQDVRLLPGVREGMSRLAAAGLRFFLHTNQSGVGRGMFEIDAVLACNQRLVELLELGPTPFTRICIAPESPGATSLYRKPSTHFAHEIMADFSLAPEQICYIGDRGSDLATAAMAGTKAIGLNTGQGDLTSELAELGLADRYPVLSSFPQAVALLLNPSYR
jgi:D-glycero-D-manno-heptose 1,7-bisphosphate phosphatase